MKSNNITNVLVPPDFSEMSLNSLETTIAIAKQQMAKITLLIVVDSSIMFGFKDVYYISERRIEGIIDISDRMFNSLLEALKEEHKLNCTFEIKACLVPQSIVKTASDIDADLIVMGTHGTSGVREIQQIHESFPARIPLLV